MSLLVRDRCVLGGSRRPRGRRHLASAADDLLLLDPVSGETTVLVVARRVLAPAGQEVLPYLVEDARELLLGRGLELAGGADRLEHAAVVAQVLEQLALEVADVLDLDVVELARGAGPDGDDLLLHRERRALG